MEIVRCRQSIPIRRKRRERRRNAWVSRNSLVQAALSQFDKFHEFPDIGRTVQLRANLVERLRGVEFGTEQQTKRALEGFQTRAIESAPLEADRVHAVAFRIALGD